MLDASRQDSRYAARALIRTPLFTITAVLSVAIGVGATTAIVTLADTLLLRPPAGIGEPDRLVNLGRTQNGQGFDNFSYPNYVDYRDGATTLSGLAALQMEPRSISLSGPDGGEAIQGAVVSGNIFEVLQARPALGRFFLAEEDRTPGTHPVAVLSHQFWRERFGSDTSVVGGRVVLNGSTFTVVGVAAEGFKGPFIAAPDLWVPMMAATLVGSPEGLLAGRQNVWLIAIGRLAPNATIDAAQAELSAIAHSLQQSYPDANRGMGVRVMPSSTLPGEMRTIVGGFMALLFAVAGLVLLIASTNVAGMLLARASSRQREIAVRLALGATRRRLVAQLVTESLMLFLVAAVAGVALAYWLVAGLMSLIPQLPVQLAVDPTIDARVLGFALGISMISGMVAGLIPALQSTRPTLVPALKSDAAGSGRRLRLRSALLVAQIAFSMLLLIVAGLFARALVHARAIDPGFDPRGVHLTSVDLALANYDAPRGQPLAATLRERAARIPGVRSAALTAVIPLDNSGLGLGRIEVPGTTPPNPERGWDADWSVITPGFFETLRLPIVRGRDFTDADRAGSVDVAIVNETLARRLWPDGDAIGRTFRNGERTITIVGIARDAKYRSLGEDPRSFVYVPLAQRYFRNLTLLVRTTTDNAAVSAPIRRLLAELDPALPILADRTLVEHAAISLFPQRIALWTAGSLGVVALLLALLGIYGVTAYGVTQRTREIGVRVALGAQRGNVLGLILRQGLMLAGLGVVAGALVAFGVTRLLDSLLVGVPPTDIPAFAGAAIVLVLAALVASWFPARRAAAVDPVIALRSE